MKGTATEVTADEVVVVTPNIGIVPATGSQGMQGETANTRGGHLGVATAILTGTESAKGEKVATAATVTAREPAEITETEGEKETMTWKARPMPNEREATMGLLTTQNHLPVLLRRLGMSHDIPVTLNLKTTPATVEENPDLLVRSPLALPVHLRCKSDCVEIPFTAH